MYARSATPSCGPFPALRRTGVSSLPCLVILLLLTAFPLQAQDCPEPGANQGMIVSLVKNLENLENTTEVTVVPLSSFYGHSAEQCGTLELGDELRGNSGDVVVEVRCPGGSIMTLSGQFRVALVPPESDQDCKVDLRSGTAQSTSEEHTGIVAGPVSAGALHTHYEVTFDRATDGSRPSVQVYDGTVEVQARGVAHAMSVAKGLKVSLAATEMHTAPLRPQDYEQTAVVLAQVSAARASKVANVNARTAYNTLIPLYQRTLEQPANANGRFMLAEAQLDYKLSRDAVYQLARAEKAEPEQPELKAKIFLAQAVAYKQLKQPSTAATYLDRAKQISPTLIQNLEPKWIQMLNNVQPHATQGTTIHAIGQLQIAVSTRRVGTGTAFDLYLRVTDAAGNPVAGARVEVAAGGGAFSGTGGTRVEGMTDTKGFFRTTWKCHPCASTYFLDVKASKVGYVSGSASPTINVSP